MSKTKKSLKYRQLSEEQKQIVRDRVKKWRLDNRDKANDLDRSKYLRKRYGITPLEYDALHTKQEGLCALCNKPESIVNRTGRHKSRLAVDHCHKTGKVRGLLCFRCNTAIGQIEKENLVSKLPTYLGDANETV